ncbi:hypothetical protein [Streptomyces sp. WAC05858]|uniref:hypothetical protein n=1 Tax=Streptomyces TaxID=1883 RepID=UPI000F79A949|nr:hypothetical protein [Streptomyces sp. WAC05858]RSS37958.1 hypothetical protein EF902_31660 [Streptomyces sp. WAC05858]
MGLRRGRKEAAERALQAALEADRDSLPWGCADCDTDTRDEYFHVLEHVSSAAGMGPIGMLCIGCLERRLRRRLRACDFSGAPINDPAYPRPPRPKSRRLLDRLSA